MNPIEKFRQLMETKGKRLTRERELIVEDDFLLTGAIRSRSISCPHGLAENGTKGQPFNRLSYFKPAGRYWLDTKSCTNDKDVYEHGSE